MRVHMGSGVQKVEPHAVTLTDGEVLPAGMLIWDTGITPNPLVETFDCPRGKKGGVMTDSCFQVKDREGIWATVPKFPSRTVDFASRPHRMPRGKARLRATTLPMCCAVERRGHLRTSRSASLP